jgi:hypothetical protein
VAGRAWEVLELLIIVSTCKPFPSSISFHWTGQGQRVVFLN